MSDDIAIKVENLTKIYKLYNSSVDRLKEALSPIRRKYHHDFHALHDVSFEIRKGESVGIIGKNGSGKSTLLKILTGVLTPTSGTVQVDGNLSALLELGAGFNPELTGIENVYYNGMLLGYTREEMDARRDDILSFADIGEFVYQPVKTYSSGMFVRLAFSVAVQVEPEILFVDEALSVGDVFFQQKCIRKITAFQNAGGTTIFVSHDMNAVKSLCSRSILMHCGSIVEFGSAAEMSDLYSSMILKEELSNLVEPLELMPEQ
jgi:ABC-type polysaccharide/polyol phosphate transport system ATPase subunit